MSSSEELRSLRTRAEATAYDETTRYGEVLRFVSSLHSHSPLVHLEYFGQSEEGRQLPLMVLSNPPIRTPQEAKASGKPIVFVMANIHAGEVEGKEAMLAMARRAAIGEMPGILDAVVLMIAPIYNADGNERISLENRTEQNGPIGGVGTRENASGLDLNRDYMKLESREAQALIRLLVRWDPHLTVDLHTTNGSYHGFNLTYAPPLLPNVDSRITAYLRDQVLPAVGERLFKRSGWRTHAYGNFSTAEDLSQELLHADGPGTVVWRTFDHRPRFGNNYVGLRNRLVILSEAYSYLDFAARVGVTSDFVEEILRFTSEHAPEIVRLTAQVDADVHLRSGSLGISFELERSSRPAEILLSPVEKKENPRSGKFMTAVCGDVVQSVTMPEYPGFRAVRSVQMPEAYLIPNDATFARVIANLELHGAVVEELTEELTIGVDDFVIHRISTADQWFQGQRATSIEGQYQATTATFVAGTRVVRTAQPLGRLISYLLEPESDDGIVHWNFLTTELRVGEAFPIRRALQLP